MSILHRFLLHKLASHELDLTQVPIACQSQKTIILWRSAFPNLFSTRDHATLWRRHVCLGTSHIRTGLELSLLMIVHTVFGITQVKGTIRIRKECNTFYKLNLWPQEYLLSITSLLKQIPGTTRCLQNRQEIDKYLLLVLQLIRSIRQVIEQKYNTFLTNLF